MFKPTRFIVLMFLVMGVFVLQACGNDEEETYTVVFDSQGGSSVDTLYEVQAGTEIELEIPQKEGYVFRYWQVGENTYHETFTVTEDVTLVAVWEHYDPVYTVTFDSQGGTLVETVEDVEEDTVLKLEIPEKEGYVFRYWQVGENTYDETFKVTEDVTLVAVWDHYEDVFTYEILPEQAEFDTETFIRITEYTGEGRFVKVPKFMAEYPVHQIGSFTFEDSSVLEVFLPNGLKSIGSYAFKDAKALRSVVFYGDLYGYTDERQITNTSYDEIIETHQEVCKLDEHYDLDEGWVFQEGCPIHRVVSKAEPITGPGGNLVYSYQVVFDIGVSEVYSRGVRLSDTAFYGVNGITDLTFPKMIDLKPLFINALAGLENLVSMDTSNNDYFDTIEGVLYNSDATKIYFYPAGLKDDAYSILETTKEVHPIAFMSVRYLKDLHVPKSVEDLEMRFAHETSLKNIFVDEAHPGYFDIDGVLYFYEQALDVSVLVSYPSGRTDATYQIPDDTYAIADLAFVYSQLESITVPEGIVAIGNMTFYHSHLLETVILPETLTYIGSEAFRDTALRSITIPSQVFQIGGSVFQGTPIEEIILMTDLENQESVFMHFAFNTLSEDTVIYVQDEHYEAFKQVAESFVNYSLDLVDIIKPLSERD